MGKKKRAQKRLYLPGHVAFLAFLIYGVNKSPSTTSTNAPLLIFVEKKTIALGKRTVELSENQAVVHFILLFYFDLKKLVRQLGQQLGFI